jgi:hypothetical protein
MRPARLSAVLSVCAGILVAIYFWKFTHVSLRTSFSDDDLMNLFFAWREPFLEIIKANFFIPTNVIRPFGALFYSTFYHLFGLDGLPFRVFCYAVLWCNVLLTYVFARRLTGSREIGLIAVLLHCYQANYFPMYYGSGYCFDVFAFFFYYAAFILALYQKGCVAIAILFACAVNSKEAAASLPAILLIYELLYNPPKSIAWIWREARAVLITGCVGALFLWARFTGPNNLLAHPAYAPAFTLERYLLSTANYLNELTSHENLWTPQRAAILLAAMALIAIAARSRHLCFSWLLIVIGATPIAFVQPRGVAAYYIPLVGYAIFFAVILVRAREFLVRSRAPIPNLASQAILFILIFTINWKYQQKNQRRFPDYWTNLELINGTIAEFCTHDEWFPKGSVVLIASDPFPENEWASTFIALLSSNDHSLVVHRQGKSAPAQTYNKVITYKDRKYEELQR